MCARGAGATFRRSRSATFGRWRRRSCGQSSKRRDRRRCVWSIIVAMESPDTGAQCSEKFRPPEEICSDDIGLVGAALLREAYERQRAECSAGMQTEIVSLALDLLVREPDIKG